MVRVFGVRLSHLLLALVLLGASAAALARCIAFSRSELGRSAAELYRSGKLQGR